MKLISTLHMMELDALHGEIEIVAQAPIDDSNDILVCRRANHPFRERAYVVWFYNYDSGFYSGKYDLTREQALRSFANRLTEI